MSPCLKKWGGHTPRVPHQIVPMRVTEAGNPED